MNMIDIQPLKDIDSEYTRLSESIAEKLSCEWDDHVHDSYLRYVHQIQNYSQRIHKIKCEVETIIEVADSYHIEDIKKKSIELCRRADAI